MPASESALPLLCSAFWRLWLLSKKSGGRVNLFQLSTLRNLLRHNHIFTRIRLSALLHILVTTLAVIGKFSMFSEGC